MGAHDEPTAAGDEPHLVAGRYELGPVIGAGSSAEVHRARDLRLGTEVAVKRFRVGASAHDLRQQRREMEALANLHHPGLVGLHDGGTEAGRAFVVTDLVEGPTLAERVSAGPPLAPGAVRRLGAQLAEALAHVHAAGIVHRDVKPANVLLGDGARPRLADFGISRTLDATTATANGCVVGTAAYLAPEQVRGERVGPGADVYALGLVLLEALTGRREFPGLAVESATARLHRSPVIPDGLPGGLGTVLAAMTRDDPARRPAAAVVAKALAADPASAAAHLWPGAGAPAPRSRGGRHRLHRMARSRVASRLAMVALAGALAMLSGAAGPSTAPTATEVSAVAETPVP
jgi:eukaryotic-like serine/threonine-protein kinase